MKRLQTIVERKERNLLALDHHTRAFTDLQWGTNSVQRSERLYLRQV